MSCNYVRPHIWHICVLSGRQSDTERPLLIIWIPSLAKMLYFFLFLVSPAALLFVVLNAVHGLAFMLCQACVFMHMISVFSHLVLIHILFRFFFIDQRVHLFLYFGYWGTRHGPPASSLCFYYQLLEHLPYFLWVHLTFYE